MFFLKLILVLEGYIKSLQIKIQIRDWLVHVTVLLNLPPYVYATQC